MAPVPQTMSANQLQSWRRRWRLSLTDGAVKLGISRRAFCDYLAETYPIPRTLALLCACYDKLWKR